MPVTSSEQFAAFLATHYRVHHATAPFVLRIGAHSAALQQIQRAQGAEASAYLTAWNPLGETISSRLNADRQRALQRDLQELNVNWIGGEGIDPATGWREESVLALGLSREQAIVLGNKYQQLAIVWSGQDAVPELILL